MLRIFAAMAALVLAVPPAVAKDPPMTSRITGISGVRSIIQGNRRVISGVATGVIDPRESIVGLGALPKNPAGEYEYTSQFELIWPSSAINSPDDALPQVIYVDSENRGSAISQGALGQFLPRQNAGYARIQWQTGISAGVPEGAQGVGLAIMRDFARFLDAGSQVAAPQQTYGFDPTQLQSLLRGPDRKLILGGISQSAWFVNTFIAEGFNVDPVTKRGVFDAAIAVDGAGGWLAINNLAAERGEEMRPYVAPNGKPLSRRELLSRPRTDPLYVDIANYTDFYRLRAGLTSVDFSGRKFRRYDFPAAHVSGRGLTAARCNGGVRIQQNPVGYQPYMRAIVLGMMKQIGVKSARSARPLPRSTVFRLAPEQPPASPNFNPLPGVFTPVPRVNADGWPVGGVSFPDKVYPLGRPEPAAVAPAVTTSINETCGNSGGFQPFGRAALDARYGSRENYLGLYDRQIEWLVRQGFLLEEDRQAMVDNAAELYALWP